MKTETEIEAEWRKQRDRYAFEREHEEDGGAMGNILFGYMLALKWVLKDED